MLKMKFKLNVIGVVITKRADHGSIDANTISKTRCADVM